MKCYTFLYRVIHLYHSSSVYTTVHCTQQTSQQLNGSYHRLRKRTLYSSILSRKSEYEYITSLRGHDNNVFIELHFFNGCASHYFVVVLFWEYISLTLYSIEYFNVFAAAATFYSIFSCCKLLFTRQYLTSYLIQCFILQNNTRI